MVGVLTTHLKATMDLEQIMVNPTLWLIRKKPVIYKDTYEIPKDSKWEKQVKPKAEFIDCKCIWGLFRDRNITMRKPVRFHTGQKDLDLKGIVTSYNNKNVLNWWQEGSPCDQVKGQDASTLPPD